MGYTLYDASIANMAPGLDALSAILKKGDAHFSSKGASLDLEARLAEDMLPLAFQVHVVTDIAQKAVARMQGTEPEELSKDDLKTLADCEARIAKTLDLVKAADRAKIDGRVDEQVTMQMGKDKQFTMTAGNYVNAFSLPNFFFHIATAYAILRKDGVDLGKTDYLTPFFSKYAS